MIANTTQIYSISGVEKSQKYNLLPQLVCVQWSWIIDACLTWNRIL